MREKLRKKLRRKLKEELQISSLSLFMAGTLLFATMASSCLPLTDLSTSRSSQNAEISSDDGNEANDPNYSSSEANYLQQGSTSSTTSLTVPSDSTSSLYLRGKDIHNYISEGNENTVQCLLIPYDLSAVKRTLVVKATPKYFFNFSTNIREYYYLLSPSERDENQNFCQTANIISAIENSYSGLTPLYQLSDLCPNCALTTLLSRPIDLRTQGGIKISSLSLNNLRIKVSRTLSEDDEETVSSCSTDSTCVSKGYDCCSEGQCVNDGEVKSNVDQSSESYAQALEDIANNPSALYNYSEFFHICGSHVTPDPTPTNSADPDDIARERFLSLENLYNCTTPSEGEMSLCRIKYNDVQEIIKNEGSNIFETAADDRNFNSTYSGRLSLPRHSLYKVDYAGETLFEKGAIIKGMTIGSGGDGSGNDNLSDTQIINLTSTPSSSAPHDNLTITYKIDGSCTKISTYLAKCSKVYTQGGNEGLITDHYPASNEFRLPYYADLSKTLAVDVDGAKKLLSTDWRLNQVSRQVEFIGEDLQVFDTQVVTISFFVNLQNSDNANVYLSKKKALDKIQDFCDCVSEKCYLKKVYEDDDESKDVIDYACYYPDNSNTEPPLQQTVILSAKTVAHRFFDKDGVYQSNDKLEESDEIEQEGTLFEYNDSAFLKPNNVDNYIGFNEIYGSFTKSSRSAIPAQEVSVKEGSSYDIFTNSGKFSTCYYCGKDYYSSLSRLFPQSFTSNGGGYTPNYKENNPLKTSLYRKDDILFGRACFVPATMIPWTHAAASTRQTQRRNRLAAQHFMFANGYQRDWYGFDYGSLIGSFDGVKWFSIGNQRRIRATSTKLFLAINGYYGDLTNNDTWSVTVQDISTVSDSGSYVTSDFDSDGAECQKAHICDSDSDCISQLGWEYSCEIITGLSSPWPRFDSNGLEVPGVSDIKNLRGLFKATEGGNKRCVYRGRGALCMEHYSEDDPNLTFDGTNRPGLHGCTSNNFCMPFANALSFNNRIARFGKSVRIQNSSSAVEEEDLDLVGLGSRVLGRPYAWRAEESIPVEAESNFNRNSITAMCIPGRNHSDTSVYNNMSSPPTSDSYGDQINAIGVTPNLPLSDYREDYLSRCSILDENGDYLYKDDDLMNLRLSNEAIRNLASSQAIPTNALTLFESSAMSDTDITKIFETDFIEELYLQENRCLRAPGSSCFSALDCAPNPYISSTIDLINEDDATVQSILNRYEILFWKEELICSQEYDPDDDEYDIGENRCCRETGKNITIPTSTVDASNPSLRDIDYDLIPGVSTSLNSQTRNSRLSTVWDLMSENSTQYPPLTVNEDNQCASGACANFSELENQFNTFAKMADRTCCSKNWIRNFDENNNGGGHTWNPDKTQTIPKESFRCYNYIPCEDDNGDSQLDNNECSTISYGDFVGFNCAHTPTPDNSNCTARNIPLGEAEEIFSWVEKFELTGIPQIAIEGSSFANLECQVNPDDQSTSPTTAPPYTIPPDLLETPDTQSNAEYSDGTGHYFSATDSDNFNEDNIKTVFSSDTLTCCLPAGTLMGSDGDPSECCTGYIGSNKTCQLPNYSNVSLYLNRYVSSEAQDEGLGSFDPHTGYLRSSTDVIRIACQKNICESGAVVPGVSLSSLRVRGHETSNFQKQRFIDGNDESNDFSGFATIYDRGIRWNTHIYCTDDTLQTDLPNTFDCSNF